MRQLAGRCCLVASLVLAFCVASAEAQATRTWVSGVGDDANPCSRTAPCKTFAGAISKTATGGEINVLDPGGFGGVTITKSITISSEGFEAGVLVSGTNAIVINATTASNVVLRGLDIEGLGTGLVGIKVLGGLGSLKVEDCVIHNFRGANGSGIEIATTTAGLTKVFVQDTIVRNNGQGTGGGIHFRPTGSATVRASLDNVTLQNNVFGLKAQDATIVTVNNSTAAGNSFAGFSVVAPTVAAVLNLVDTTSASNNTGVTSSGANALARINGVTVTNNLNTGLEIGAGGQIVSAGNNFVQGNNPNGAPSSTPGLN